VLEFYTVHGPPERSPDALGCFRIRSSLTNRCGQQSRASTEGDILHLMLNYHEAAWSLGLAGYLSCYLGEKLIGNWQYAVNSGRLGCSL
jgi:hypothetical protein